MLNQTIFLKSRPIGMITRDNFEIKSVELPELNEGEVQIKTLYLSVDPYMRGRMSDAKSYAKPYPVNQPLNGRVIGEVIQSKSSSLQVGDKVFGVLDWAEYVTTQDTVVEKIPESIEPITAFLHVLGMPGMTAYLGFTRIGEPKARETVVVSGAGGAVGMIVGQLAKIYGCHVIGITGSDVKKSYLLHELGFDAVINYRETANLKEELNKLAPEGVDIYFDNVGGDISDAVYLQMNFHGRVILCGQISQYNNTEVEQGLRVFPHFLTRSVKLQGFILKDFKAYFSEARDALQELFTDQKLKYKEHVYHGINQVPDALIGLFRGENLGKSIVKIDKQN